MDVIIFRILVEEGCFPLWTEGGTNILKDKSFSFRLFWEDELRFIKCRRDTNGGDGVSNS